jgi:KUP system potassium uptake protein
LLINDLGKSFFRVRIFYGFMEEPDIPAALELCSKRGLPFDMMTTSFFVSRAMIVSSPNPGMNKLRGRLFMALSRNAQHAADFFKIPSNRVIEMGTRVEI